LDPHLVLLSARRNSLIDRRTFLVCTGAVVLGTPLASEAQQQGGKVYRIGMLLNSLTSTMVGPQPRNRSVKAFLGGLRELGYIYGEHFVTERRGSAGKPERFPALTAELIRLRVDVIVAAGPALPAVKQATSKIPVVMAASLDPVVQGYVQSLGHPGGNFTGLSLQSVETTGKQLELLKELVPRTAPLAVLWNETSILNWRAAEAASRRRRLSV
jgi:putative tryptophan/tyrosine transport system substrate-binding protein